MIVYNKMVEKYKRGHVYPGLFISLESGEGGGKGTQKDLLIKNLRKKGYDVVEGREPGATEFGETLRNILQNPEIYEINKRSELFLYLSARAEYVDEVVTPVLEDGGIFVSDRFIDSTLAYQGYGNGTDLSLIGICNEYSINGLNADLTFLLDVNAEDGLGKVSGDEFKGHKLDKIESRGLEYHHKVNDGYRNIAKNNSDRIKVIPYIDNGIYLMSDKIINHIDEFIGNFNLDGILKKS